MPHLTRSTRSRLLWLLAVALLGAPLARAVAARAQWIDVPYCSASATPAAGDGHAHRLLLFANAAAAGATTHAAPPQPPARAPQLACVTADRAPPPTLAPGGAARRLPPARAPPQGAA